MHITRLRLLGFKSFVEPAELVIEQGLTGVVGPNGCGKSNLLEALRWVMGETSFKSMRASSMEDVIFSGSSARPARNFAEVTIALDNRQRSAHPAFNDDDNLEITRRIEREHGSQYRINGRPVRARDVQLLFADASTGARSPALVQQGRIGEIVSAKPQQRRFILEEAAGIAGLHGRRHEAEIKLRGAEANLERLQDIIAQMESSLAGLRRQERQVQRYRRISRDIEQLQVMQLYSDWKEHADTLSKADEQARQHLQVAADLTRQESKIRQMLNKAAAGLPELRQQEMIAAAVLQRLNLKSEQLEREQKARQKRRDELAARCAQQDADLAREQRLQQEDRQRRQDLKAELAELNERSVDDAEKRRQVARQAGEKRKELDLAERELLALRRELAEQGAMKASLKRQHEEKSALVQSLQKKLSLLKVERDEVQVELSQIGDYGSLDREIRQNAAQVDRLETQLKSMESKLAKAYRLENDRLQKHMEAQAGLQMAKSEIGTLKNLLFSPQKDSASPVLDEIGAMPGYETALGAALGDDLEASLDEQADICWRQGGEGMKKRLSPLPPGTLPLDRFVSAPKAILARLQMTGIVKRDEGNRLQEQLAPGQRLVSIEGDLWRWDGFTARADAPTNAAHRLLQKNRLEQLQKSLQDHHLAIENAQQSHRQASEKRRQLESDLENIKNSQRELHQTLETQQRQRAVAERQALVLKGRLEALESTDTDLQERLAGEGRQLKRLAGDIAGFESLTHRQKLVESRELSTKRLRAACQEIETRHDRLKQQERHHVERMGWLQDEIARLKARHEQGKKQLETLLERRDRDRAELSALEELPKQIVSRRQSLNDELKKAEKQRASAADRLQQAENTLREIERSLQDMQGRAGEAREQQAAAGAILQAAQERLAEQERLILQRLHCKPQDCLQKAGLHDEQELPRRQDLQHRLEQAEKSRERLGNVNLCAAREAEELAGRIDEMSLEHKDLTEAINALRTAISSLNREGRRRLLAAFEKINHHFESLFTTLFGGGKASLKLVESDDPLQAGLEIIASPPGKKPQVLTLLSGGEKALTAMSLIFAVFLTNPAPICVLDEVDAPLDDANVERFCNLLDEMTRNTDTRFLVITHHPTTMSRMDRLFGVTMAEKGISQMVSVDLSTASSFGEKTSKQEAG